MKFDNPYYEPKLSNRFILNFPKDLEIDIKEYFIKKIKRPSYNNNHDWTFLSIEIIDTITDSILNKIFDKIIGKPKLKNFDITLETLDPTGIVISKTIYKIKELENIEFSELNYSNSDLQTITFNFSISDVTLEF